MGTPAPVGSSLGHPSSHYLFVCAVQMLLAPFQVPPAPTGFLSGHPLPHFHPRVCSCSGQRGASWAGVKGRDGKRGEEAQAHPWIRCGGCGVGSACSRDGSRLCGLCFADTASPQPQIPSHCRHCRGDNQSPFQYLKDFAAMRISPHATRKPTCKAEFPRGKKIMLNPPLAAHIPPRIPPAASQLPQVSLAHLPSQLGWAPQKAETATAPLTQPSL